MPARVSVLTDHALVAWSLERMVTQRPGLEAAAPASLNDETVLSIELSKPDVVVVDAAAKTGPVIAQLRALIDAGWASKMLVILSSSQAELGRSLIDHGVASVASCEDRVEEIGLCLDSVAAGRSRHSTQLQPTDAEDASRDEQSKTSWQRLDSLTAREREVFELIARGLSKKEIADKLFLSVKTVDNHATSLMRKLHIHDRVHLARFAMQHGLVAW